MVNKNDNSNLNQQSDSLNATHESKFSNSSSSKYKNVEPLPESSRPRRDGPGGEDGE